MKSKWCIFLGLLSFCLHTNAQNETVNGTLTVNGPIIQNMGNTQLLIYRDNDVGDWSLLRPNLGNGIGLIGKPDDIALSVSRLTSNVGIGTNMPIEKLELNGNFWSYS